MKFTRFSGAEMERRRLESIAALRELERAEFNERYQFLCDRDYWTKGQRCSGCDYWQSEGGRSGQCTAASIVSGEEVCRSVGIHCPPRELLEPGFPYTKDSDWCGRFKDDFDWSSLDADYLVRIGAMREGKLLSKPRPPR